MDPTINPPVDPVRLRQLVEAIVDRVEAVEAAAILDAMPPQIAAVVKLARGWPLRLDLVETVRGMAIGSLLGLPELAASDPERAAAIAAAGSGAIAWLTGQRDELPSLTL